MGQDGPVAVKRERHPYNSLTAPDRDEADLFRLAWVLCQWAWAASQSWIWLWVA
ncbi:hypothetical protein AA3990_2132 [Gluconobacter roseus NBRC 3990]|nr:hypothetical protein AA3990_2132 [Gluconobacter roseus NBRC 3990]